MLQMQAKSATLWLVLGKTARAMTDASNALPNEIDALRALILAERAAHALIIADSDEVARAFRDDVARCSDMKSPGVRCLAG
jgi:hypothetical protein